MNKICRLVAVALLLILACTSALGTNLQSQSSYSWAPSTGFPGNLYPQSPDSNLPASLFFIASASSEYQLKYNTEYSVDASMAVDNDLTTAWNEGAPDVGIGEWIMLYPGDGRTYTYQGFHIANGFQYHDYYKGDRWVKNNRVKFLQVYNDRNEIVGAFQVLDLSDGYQTIYFENPVTTSYLRFQIMGAWMGEQHPETCISELRPF